eukprot:7015727-Heterocapsa_arctica.AAC.1
MEAETRLLFPSLATLDLTALRWILLLSVDSKTEPCQKAIIRVEREDLEKKEVWDMTTVREWRSVQEEDPTQTEAMCGRLFAILGERDSELPPELRKFRARVVFAWNAIRTKTGTAAEDLFQE